MSDLDIGGMEKVNLRWNGKVYFVCREGDTFQLLAKVDAVISLRAWTFFFSF
jgi:hypothetical protein